MKQTGCGLQGKDGGWPCGTCFGTFLQRVKPELDKSTANGLWQSLLVYRGDYTLDMVEQTQEAVDKNIVELKRILTEKDGEKNE